MNTPTTAPASLSSAKREYGVIYFVGRIEAVSKSTRGFSTLFKTKKADADEYAYPNTHVIRSKARFGSPGDVVEIKCDSTGIPRIASRTDKATGEVTTWPTADSYFNLIES